MLRRAGAASDKAGAAALRDRAATQTPAAATDRHHPQKAAGYGGREDGRARPTLPRQRGKAVVSGQLPAPGAAGPSGDEGACWISSPTSPESPYASMCFTHATFTLPDTTIPSSSSSTGENNNKSVSFHRAFMFCLPGPSQLKADEPRSSLSAKHGNQLSTQKS